MPKPTTVEELRNNYEEIRPEFEKMGQFLKLDLNRDEKGDYTTYETAICWGGWCSSHAENIDKEKGISDEKR